MFEQEEKSAFELLGTAQITKIALRFYEVMAIEEKELANVHQCDENGFIVQSMQEKFALFLVGWLGGPQLYIEKFGHPRLRMRHRHFQIDKAMRDAWLRCMAVALDDAELPRSLRKYLDERFYVMANHLMNA